MSRPQSTASRAKRIDALLALAIAGAGGGGNPATLPYVVARPIDGVTDDWPSFMGPGGVVAKAQAKGQDVIMMPGLGGQPWVCKTPTLQVPSNVTIIGTPETVINQTLNPAGGVTECAFGGTETSNASGGLAANVVLGSRTVHALVDVGNIGGVITVGTNGGLNTQLLHIRGKSGTVPDITYTVDRPILVAATTVSLATGTITQLTAYPTNINIYGNGMLISGTGESFVHWSPGVNTNIYDINMVGDAVNTTSAVQYDVSSYDSDVQRIRVTTCQGGAFGIVGTQNIRLDGCLAQQAGITGYALEDSIECFVTDCEADTCGQAGARMDGSPGSPGTILSEIRGGSYNSNSDGIVINNLSNRNHIVGAKCVGNTGSGVSITTGVGGSPTLNTLTGVTASYNLNGISATGGSQTIIEGCQANDNSFSDLNLAANVHVSGFSSRFSLTTEAHVNINVTAGVSRFENISVQTTAHDGSPVQLAGTARVSMTDATLTMDGGGTPIAFLLSGTSVIALANISLAGTGTVIGVNGNTGTTTRLGQNVNLSGKAGVFAFNIATPGAFCSKSFISGSVNGGPPPFTANGVTPVAVPFPDLRLEDTVLIQLEAGTVAAGIAPGTLTQTPGTGFTYTGSNVGDTGLYSWRVVG